MKVLLNKPYWQKNETVSYNKSAYAYYLKK